jgi:hypothetical protein
MGLLGECQLIATKRFRTMSTNVDLFRELEQTLHSPEVRQSRQELETLLAREFVEIGRSGGPYDRESAISSLLLEAADGTVGTITSSDFIARPLSTNLMLLTYRSQRTLPEAKTRQTLRSSI